MPHIELPYGQDTLSLEIPPANLLGIFEPQAPSVASTPEDLIRYALDDPIACPAIEQLAQNAQQVLLIADDGTRPTPTDLIIPLLLDRLNAAGIPDEQISILVALGTHRPMTRGEILLKFGDEVTSRVTITNHDAFDANCLEALGTTHTGVPIEVNTALQKADVVIGIGSIVPHHIPGFSGGAKIIQPGVCGERTTAEVHLLSVRQSQCMLGILENPVREEMETIAERAGLTAILNTVLDASGDIVGAVFGDVRLAFRRGAELARQVYGVPVPREADIVLAGSHPCDSEFWQAHKTLYPAAMCVKTGGTIIAVTPCPEGVTATHPEMLQFASWSRERIDAAIRAGDISDLTAGALSLAVAAVREKASVYMVSGGISGDAARALGFEPHGNMKEALDRALAHYGNEATVSVLPYAPDTLPILGQ